MRMPGPLNRPHAPAHAPRFLRCVARAVQAWRLAREYNLHWLGPDFGVIPHSESGPRRWDDTDREDSDTEREGYIRRFGAPPFPPPMPQDMAYIPPWARSGAGLQVAQDVAEQRPVRYGPVRGYENLHPWVDVPLTPTLPGSPPPAPLSTPWGGWPANTWAYTWPRPGPSSSSAHAEAPAPPGWVDGWE